MEAKRGGLFACSLVHLVQMDGIKTLFIGGTEVGTAVVCFMVEGMVRAGLWIIET